MKKITRAYAFFNDIAYILKTFYFQNNTLSIIASVSFTVCFTYLIMPTKQISNHYTQK